MLVSAFSSDLPSSSHCTKLAKGRTSTLEHEDDKDEEEDEQDAEHFEHQPTVRRDRLEVLEEFEMSSLNMRARLLNVHVDSLNQLFLLLDQCGKLLEDAAKLHNCLLDSLHRLRSVHNVRILLLDQLQRLLETLSVQSI